MKISGIESQLAGQIAPVGAGGSVSPVTPAASSGNGAGPAANLDLSPQAQALASAKAEAASYVPVVNAVPDRDSRIAELQTQIAAGTYQVSSTDIADQILRRAQADQIAG